MQALLLGPSAQHVQGNGQHQGWGQCCGVLFFSASPGSEPGLLVVRRSSLFWTVGRFSSTRPATCRAPTTSIPIWYTQILVLICVLLDLR